MQLIKYLPIGTRVRYTKRASTRLNDFMRDMPKGFQDARPEYALEEMKHPERPNGYRNVEVWDEEGEGWIVGLVRRQEGPVSRSYNGGSSWGMYDSEPEQSYLMVERVVSLYQVKSRLDQATPVLVPLDAVEAVVDPECDPED